MTQSKRDETIRAAELALAETLQKVRAEIAKHGESGEGAPPIPRSVRYTVEDMLESLDFEIERLRSDRDADVDDAIDDIDR